MVAMQRPIKNWLGNVIGALLAVYLGVLLVSSVVKNYQLGQQISSLQGQINQLQSQHTQLAFELQYYQTDSYRQKEAKADLGLVVPGENEIVLPSPSPKPQTATTTKKTVQQTKPQQWWDFLLGHQST